ncbi:MAG: hypothetical protein CVV49_08945 [Spirochaetae bacterium HGW-Spirochaetae-5]|nr:MAG: hypothetical protein CVV49_08945 [Spirochaetae bacterium HGW-Spirochaetae-5]
MFEETIINHNHRREVGLNFEEYVVAKEAYEKRHVHPMDRADIIAEKCGLSLYRVTSTLARLGFFKLMGEGDNGLEVSEKWSKNYDMYYPAVK